MSHPTTTGSTPSPAAAANTAAATDVPEFISDLDGGQLERALSVALSRVASHVVDREKAGKVVLSLSIQPIKGTHQIAVDADLSYSHPTLKGKTSESAESTTVLHVGRFGRISLAQPALTGMQGQLTG